jgi:hypothetical protein
MDDNERKEVFDRLAAILKENGLDWIVDQVTEQIHLGKTVFKEVDTVKRTGETEVLSLDLDTAPSGLRTGPKAQFPATIDYDNRERLGLLMDGIVQAINALEMEDKIIDEVQAIGGPTEITFYAEESGTTNVVVSPDKVAARGQQLSGFRDLIHKLREEDEKD